MQKFVVPLGLLGALALAAGAAAQEKEGGAKKGRGHDIRKALFKGKDKVSKKEFVKFFMGQPARGARPGAELPSPEQRRERLGKFFDSLDNDPKDGFVSTEEWKAGQERRLREFEKR